MLHSLKILAVVTCTAWLYGAGQCVIVPGGDILVRDLAKAVPEFLSTNPEIRVGFSPKCGATRILSGAELTRFARTHAVTLTQARSVCFERRTQRLKAADIQALLERSLPDATIELIDFTRAALPDGVIEFPTAGLGRGRADAPVLWRGVIKDGASAYPIWARVHVRMRRQIAVAETDLKAGNPIAPSSVRMEERALPVGDSNFLSDVNLAIGAVPKTTIKAGEIVRASSVSKPKEVGRGSKVTVRALAGAAQLSFEARAESSGVSGDMVTVRNPWNGRRFKGRVEGVRKVVVE